MRKKWDNFKSKDLVQVKQEFLSQVLGYRQEKSLNQDQLPLLQGVRKNIIIQIYMMDENFMIFINAYFLNETIKESPAKIRSVEECGRLKFVKIHM